ncbi:MAG: hypothetical protein V7767_07010 [Leeuwenhoekiella sp.]
MNAEPRNIRLYNKAIEIINLSRSISHYMGYDFSALQDDGNEHPSIYFTGDMIRHSDSLAPEIIKAENEVFQDDRLKYAQSVHNLTNRLYLTCERLERAESNGREFVQLLRTELKKFRRLHNRWMMTL